MENILTLGIETSCDGECEPVQHSRKAVLRGGRPDKFLYCEVCQWIKF